MYHPWWYFVPLVLIAAARSVSDSDHIGYKLISSSDSVCVCVAGNSAICSASGDLPSMKTNQILAYRFGCPTCIAPLLDDRIKFMLSATCPYNSTQCNECCSPLELTRLKFIGSNSARTSVCRAELWWRAILQGVRGTEQCTIAGWRYVNDSVSVSGLNLSPHSSGRPLPHLSLGDHFEFANRLTPC